jgi:hypothetical protein
MRTSADTAASSLTLEFPDREATGRFFAEALAQQAFLIHLPERPQEFAHYAVLARDPEAFELRFEACVVQVFEQDDGFGVAFQFLGWGPVLQAELDRQLAPPQPQEEFPEGENLGISPIYRIRGLDLPQKMLLAPKADRAERQILCRDNAPMVLLNLLSNPRLEAENVLALVKSNFATAELFQRVASDRRWMASTEIRTAVVRNPKTPTPIAVRLLETLPLGELRDLAKMGAAREDLRQAAFKAYTKLSGRR